MVTDAGAPGGHDPPPRLSLVKAVSALHGRKFSERGNASWPYARYAGNPLTCYQTGQLVVPAGGETPVETAGGEGGGGKKGGEQGLGLPGGTSGGAVIALLCDTDVMRQV